MITSTYTTYEEKIKKKKKKEAKFFKGFEQGLDVGWWGQDPMLQVQLSFFSLRALQHLRTKSFLPSGVAEPSAERGLDPKKGHFDS